jgi:hypothetical protein
MDVDVTTSSECLATSSSFERLDLAELDLEPLNDKMRDRCRLSWWRARIEMTEDDPSFWQPVFCEVLLYLMSALQTTDAKSSVIATPIDTEAIVKSFNEKESGEWEVGVRHGVETNDWTSLITHRTYISDYRMPGSHLIATTGKLRKPKVRNVALGVPIELSAPHFSHFILLLCSHLPHHLYWLRGWYVCVYDVVIVFRIVI